jgi:hypothetical protein
VPKTTATTASSAPDCDLDAAEVGVALAMGEMVDEPVAPGRVVATWLEA